MRYFLRLSYDGSTLHGWQRQPGALSVQEIIEDALGKILRKSTPITGAGRTDAGVNAACMYAHFDTDTPIATPEKFLRSLGYMCSPRIAFQQLLPVHADAHARFDAICRTYHYHIHTDRNPFLRHYSWLCPYSLDFENMNEAADILLHTSDFTSFSKLHTDVKTNICHVTEARWIKGPQPGTYIFRISADRFLRNMVRSVVGTLIDVGRGKLSLDGFREIIRAKDRCRAGNSMPGEPLFLQEIQYPYL